MLKSLAKPFPRFILAKATGTRGRVRRGKVNYFVGFRRTDFLFR